MSNRIGLGVCLAIASLSLLFLVLIPKETNHHSVTNHKSNQDQAQSSELDRETAQTTGIKLRPQRDRTTQIENTLPTTQLVNQHQNLTDQDLWNIWKDLQDKVAGGEITQSEAEAYMRELKSSKNDSKNKQTDNTSNNLYSWTQDPDWPQLSDGDRTRRVFDHIDSNDNHVLDLDELQPYQIDQETMRLFDRNQDDIISVDEWLEVKQPIPGIQRSG